MLPAPYPRSDQHCDQKRPVFKSCKIGKIVGGIGDETEKSTINQGMYP